MTSAAELLRRHLTPAENAVVDGPTVELALERAQQGRRPRTRVEVAALVVYRGPGSTRVPTLEALPLRRSLAVRVLSGVAHPGPVLRRHTGDWLPQAA